MRRAGIAACALAAAIAIAAAAAAAPDIVGTWRVEDGRARVEVAPCGESVCGTIVWLEEPRTDSGKEKLDIHNPDERLRGRKVIGIEVFRAAKSAGPGREVWRGTIYDPEIGKTYTCKAELREGGGRLRIRGFVGVSVFGRTTYWTRLASAPGGDPEARVATPGEGA